MTIVGRGGQIRLEVTFYEYAGGQPFDPDQPLTLDIQFNHVTVLTTPFTYNPGGIIREGVGRYYAIWSVPVGADIGIYTAVWSGIVHTVTVVGTEEFNVIAAGATNPGTGSDQTLETQQFITFGGDISPVCIDPDELVGFFPEANYLEITEALRNATIDLQYVLKIKEDECPLDPMVDEYIKAAAACALSKVHGHGTLSGPGGDTTNVHLGDFEVQKVPSSTSVATSRSKILPENALTWCELAGALRLEIIMRSVGFRSIVKGRRFNNPIPRRHYQPRPGNWPITHGQGDLDNPPDYKNWS